MFIHRTHCAFAHDQTQDAFMAFAAMYVEANPVYREIEWLRDWRTFWIESRGNQGNGLSDVGNEEYLTDDGRITRFLEFLRDYRSWVASSGASISWLTDYKPDRLIAFAELMEAVLTGDETHPGVKRTDG
ncbi:hypothetical protein ACQEVY_24430 [Streptomyces sp. CA-288835]|uniref:hypothetical protein n=1 Tax=Streptomyces sp. CA-288835 TaxID=3240069 RepID=UPI003D8E3910